MPIIFSILLLLLLIVCSLYYSIRPNQRIGTEEVKIDPSENTEVKTGSSENINGLDDLDNDLNKKYSNQLDRYIKFLQIEARSKSRNTKKLISKIIKNSNIKDMKQFESYTGLSRHNLYTGAQQEYSQQVGRDLTLEELAMERDDIIALTE